MHLSDDQGWRIEITNDGRAPGDDIDYERLTQVSGATAIDEGGTDNLPGQTGFLTQAEYRQVVAYAAAHYITVIPEIDLPGHSSAILHSIPQLNTGRSVPQPPPGQDTIPANTTQQVGESSLDTHAAVTYTFLAHVFKQLALMTPGRYAATSLTGAYSGMFTRDSSIQVMAEIAAHKPALAGRIRSTRSAGCSAPRTHFPS